jgi:hypothetical protein
VSAKAASVPLSLRDRIRSAPTPARLKAFLYGIWALAGILFLFGEMSISGAQRAMQTVGKDTAPSIIAAQEISSSLADLDANAGNYLLGSKLNQVAATQTFEQRRTQVTKRLVDAAKNITYGEAESVPINLLFDGLGRYLEYAAEMRYQKDTGDAERAKSTYAAASDLMHQRLLPAADVLDDANYAYLKDEYARQEIRSGGAEIVAGAVAAMLVGVLVWAQVFVVRHMRRLFNPALAAATVVTALFGAYLVTRIAVAREDLRIAKQDAFESIHALWKARALAYDANGDETRYLLGGPRAAAFEQAYKDKVQKLATVAQPDDAFFNAKKVPDRYKGLFADEMRNITFTGEREAAVKMIRAFAAYDKIDGTVRTLERTGKHADAVQLAIGLGALESNATFDRFDKALRETIDINVKQFDATVESGMAALGLAAKILPLASLLIGFLALFGIRPRIREYAA